MNCLSLIVLLVATTIATSVQGVEISFTNAKLDCRRVRPITLKQLKDNPNGACQQVEDLVEMGNGNSADTGLDLVNTCSCSILDKKFLFEELLTDEVESLFESIKLILDEFTEDDEVDEQEFMDLFVDNFNPKMKAAFVDHFYRFNQYTNRKASTNMLVDSCNSLRADFDFVVGYFKSMGTLVGDSSFLHKMVRHDDNLFRLIAVHKACELFPATRASRKG